MTDAYQCPRCDSYRMIALGENIECVNCRSEFEIWDLDNIEDKSTILTVQEKKAIIDALNPESV